MYAVHYGFREKPFALSPDPRYLFLSASHREVLGHLVYGIEQGEGFMAISGEVGTGKTTLCRTLLERLGSSCEIAFLFNPTLGPTDLIKAINAELGLSTFGDSRTELLDVLNTFLLEKHAEGRRVLVIIDEAQNLPVETLEQLRLLSNLETHTAKLLQIVLIGQPEIDAKLDAPELRQLRQRIGVWWRLGPLQRDETLAYVAHRLRVAGGSETIFSPSAIALVHRHARGVPRLVNLLCDRALLLGYAEGARQIGRGIVTSVAREVHPPRRTRSRRGALRLAMALTLVALGAVAWLGRPERAPLASAPAASLAPVAAAPIPLAREAVMTSLPDPAPTGPAAVTAPAPGALTGDDVLGALAALQTPEQSLAAATRAVFALWQIDAAAPSGRTLEAADEALRVAGLTTMSLAPGEFDRLRELDLPSLVALRAPDGGTRFALLRRISGGNADLEGIVAGQSVRVSVSEWMRHWTGEALVPWRDFAGLPPSLGPGDQGAPVEWLQDALARLAFYSGARDGRFDPDTRAAVQSFQRGAGIEPDGRVGARTKLALYRALPDYALPLLAAPAHTPPASGS
ncbi:MAG TPA: AAA family ATPase [Myxococcota bacterium]|nr:AAA family ATPase [Myxococcota bacterium]